LEHKESNLGRVAGFIYESLGEMARGILGTLVAAAFAVRVANGTEMGLLREASIICNH
jgi:hypothetical protein